MIQISYIHIEACLDNRELRFGYVLLICCKGCNHIGKTMLQPCENLGNGLTSAGLNI